jgi:hypothetical protein
MVYFNSKRTLKEYFKKTKTIFLIEDAFYWSKSEQGFDFWKNIDKKLKDELE